jgi:hypothetical protein
MNVEIAKVADLNTPTGEMRCYVYEPKFKFAPYYQKKYGWYSTRSFGGMKIL